MNDRNALRVLITAAAYCLTLLVVVAIAFIVVIFVAGPHSGLLPPALEVVVIALGWLGVLILPVLAAWLVWRRLGPRPVHRF